MSKRYMKKWWIETELSDGNIFKGWVNTMSNNEDDFPEMLYGTFFAFKNKGENGMHGWFILNRQTEDEAKEQGQYVIMNGIFSKPIEIGHPPMNAAEADMVLESLRNLHYEAFERFERKLEECIVLKSTYITEY